MHYLVLFQRLILRPLRAEPVRTLLTLLAVALGVAVVLAIEMAGEAAAGSFQSSVESLVGDADFEVTATGGVPPEALTTLAMLPFPLTIRPRIEDYAVIVATGKTVPLIGIDALSYAVDKRDAIWAGPELGWKVGQQIDVLLNDRPITLTVHGLLPEKAGAVIGMDLAAATSALRRNGTLDRLLVEAQDSDVETELRKALGPGYTVAPFGSRTGENRRMLAAFRWNLRVLSYIALVVGAFLIYNTISVSVVRRRTEIGILRSLGTTRGGVLLAFLGEAACFGLLGAALGLAFGRILAESAVQLVSITVESLYVSSRPGAIELTWPVALIGLTIGLVVALLSAFLPAWKLRACRRLRRCREAAESIQLVSIPAGI